MKLNAEKATSPALVQAARASVAKRDYRLAEGYLREIARRQEPNHEAAFLMSEVMRASGKKADAIRLLTEAIQMDPGNIQYMVRFIVVAGREAVKSFSPTIDAAIETCLTHASVLPISDLGGLWVSHLYTRPDFRAAYMAPISGDSGTNLQDFTPLLTPYFLKGLTHITVTSTSFEGFLMYLRRHVLEDVAEGKRHLSPEGRLALGAALAHYGFNCDYILGYTSDHEVKTLQGLRARVEASAAPTAEEAVALACYVPLYKLKNADGIEKAYAAHDAIKSVVKSQIADWRALTDEAGRIESVTSISEGVSSAVRAQYEEFPYPRWDVIPASEARRGWERQREEFPFMKAVCSGKFKGLIAGCGTGAEPVAWGLNAPEANFLAVDLSRTSLAYARTKAREHGVTNVDFRHGDILKLDTLGRKFDLVVSSGVLHHMESPIEGWRTLTGLLNDDGVMRIALYSKIARRGVLAAQEVARKNGYTGERDSMLAFRRDCPKNFSKPLMANLMGLRDYYILSMYRDLLFHVQEHDYDLLDISAMLDELGLEFRGFAIDSNVGHAFRAMFPFAKNMMNLSDWHKFEQKNPDTFIAMYQFWCRKKKA